VRGRELNVPLQQLLIEVLADPVDKGPLLYFEDREVLYNPRRKVAYSISGSIPVMLPDEARAVDDDEHAALMAGASAAVETGKGRPGA
jgi:uncharacterized protein YbaR (Trm112 family)